MSLDPKAALEHFKNSDSIMAELLEASLEGAASLTLPIAKKPSEYFGSILTSVVSQQISTHAARAINARVKEALGALTPEAVIAIDFMTLKACGLSEKKTTYIKNNAAIWHDIPVHDFERMTDEEIIKELTKLYGIGRWTAEMFLLFSLARPDVFSYGDLGLMQSLYLNYSYHPHYKKKIRSTVDSWSPHRSVASLVLWHSRDTRA